MGTTMQTMTLAQFEALLAGHEADDRLLELIDGEVYEKMPTEQHGVIVLNIAAALKAFVEARQMGRVGVEIRHTRPGESRFSLLPDISYTAARSAALVVQGSVPRMPDLAVEVRSHGDVWRKLRAKAAYYLDHGTQMVWLVDPLRERVFLLTQDEEDVLGIADVIDGGSLLPGFRLPVRDALRDPLA
jgi:Uma2 family endonuclease